MLKVSKPSNDRLDIELSGALDADAMRSALDQLLEQSDGITNGTMLYTISDFAMPTLSAMAVEFLRMPQLICFIRKFDKCAVVSDAAWIRTAAEFEGAIIPSLKIKSFNLDSVPAAEAWLSETSGEEDDDEEIENVPV